MQKIKLLPLLCAVSIVLIACNSTTDSAATATPETDKLDMILRLLEEGLKLRVAAAATGCNTGSSGGECSSGGGGEEKEEEEDDDDTDDGDVDKSSTTTTTLLLQDNNEGSLVEARNISFRIGLFSLFGSDIKVKSVEISDGALYIKRDRKGRVNYSIFKKGEKKELSADTSSDNLGISIEEASFENMELIYIDEIADQEIVGLLDNLRDEDSFGLTLFDTKTQIP